MRNLLCVSHKILHHLPDDIKDQLLFYKKFDKDFWTGTANYSKSRYGKDYCPWKITQNYNLIDNPTLSLEYNCTFKDITDSRSRNLIEHTKLQNKRLGIFWSGGIDSTVILAALLKNLNSYELSLIDVFMNHYSIVEYPQLFKNFIKEKLNYKIVNSNVLNNNTLKTHVITDGEPADKLWMVQIGLTFASIYGSSSLQKPFIKNIDAIIEFMSYYMPLDDSIRWYEILEDNIKDYTEFVETTADFFSWINFNFHSIGHMYNGLMYGNVEFEDYITSYKPWYSCQEYQKWAWGTYKTDKNIFNSLYEYKMIAKKYIFDLTKDEYFLNFKTKIASINPAKIMKDKINLMIFDDGTYVTEDDPNLLNYVKHYLKQ